MSAHTPGPWCIAPPAECGLGDGLYVEGAEDKPIAFASSGNEADARLIIAAPDLLEVARLVLGMLAGDRNEHPQKLQRAASAAIAKAEGHA